MYTVNCPHCGKAVPAGSRFCPDCGGALPSSVSDPGIRPAQPVPAARACSPAVRRLFLVSCVVLLCLWAGSFLLWMAQHVLILLDDVDPMPLLKVSRGFSMLSGPLSELALFGMVGCLSVRVSSRAARVAVLVLAAAGTLFDLLHSALWLADAENFVLNCTLCVVSAAMWIGAFMVQQSRVQGQERTGAWLYAAAVFVGVVGAVLTYATVTDLYGTAWQIANGYNMVTYPLTTLARVTAVALFLSAVYRSPRR